MFIGWGSIKKHTKVGVFPRYSAQKFKQKNTSKFNRKKHNPIQKYLNIEYTCDREYDFNRENNAEYWYLSYKKTPLLSEYWNKQSILAVQVRNSQYWQSTTL